MAADEAVRPLPFVLVGDDGGFSVNPEAVERLERVKGRLVVVAVAGLYRTGKSFLLNLLVRHAKGIDQTSAAGDQEASGDQEDDAPGFAVGGTVNACTKGIWMWGEPIPMEDGSSLLFLDTEGLGSVDREQTHDTRIFALALLLATNFIYNSRGVIDGNAIEDLSLVVNLSKHIQTSSAKDGGGGGGNDLHNFFPTFMWVVRDFTLQLQDNGKKISSKQYLENALKPTGGYSDDAMAKDQIRMLISDFFRERDCVTLVRPVDDEMKLRSLPKVPYGELRDEFRSSFESLRRRVFDKAKPKMMFGKPLNGSMYVNLVQSYVEALNSGKAPVISSAWSRVVQAQCEDALRDAIELYRTEMTARVRPYASPDQYERDADFERVEEEDDSLPRDSKGLAVVDHGQGGNAMFDEYGNLRAVPLKLSASADIDEADDDENAPESEMIEAMEENDGAGDDDEAERGPERTRLPCSEDSLRHVHKVSKKVAKKKLRDVVDEDMSDDALEYFENFRSSVRSVLDTFRQQNAAASMSYCRHVLEQLSQGSDPRDSILGDGAQKSAMELFRETQSYLTDVIDDLHTQYMTRAVGPSRDAAYCEFVSQRVVGQVIERTERTNAAHMTEVRVLEKQLNDLSVQVAIAQGQASAMQELSVQQRQKCELSVREAEQRCASELASLRSTLDFKTNELEHILNHNATMKRLADTAQQGQYRATEFASSAFASVLAGYLIKQSVLPGQAPSRNKWQQRYFVLQGPQLSFYDTKDDYERCRSDNPPMDVTGAMIEDNMPVPEAFSISFQDDKYYPLHLHARSVDNKKEWVTSLRRAATGNRMSTAGGGPPGYAYGNSFQAPPGADMGYSSGGRYMQM